MAEQSKNRKGRGVRGELELVENLQENTLATRPSPLAPLWPTETEIYILPDGRIVIADLPVELNAAIAELGIAETDAE